MVVYLGYQECCRKRAKSRFGTTYFEVGNCLDVFPRLPRGRVNHWALGRNLFEIGEDQEIARVILTGDLSGHGFMFQLHFLA